MAILNPIARVQVQKNGKAYPDYPMQAWIVNWLTLMLLRMAVIIIGEGLHIRQKKRQCMNFFLHCISITEEEPAICSKRASNL